MNTHQITSFSDVRYYLSRLPSINEGGCAIAAYAMYLWLKKHDQLTDDFAFVFGYRWNKDSFNTNQEVLDNNKGPAHSASHVFIYTQGRYMDTNCENTTPNNYAWHHIIKEEWFLVSSLNNGVWNSDFDRVNIKDIQEVLDVDMSNINQ